jgi:hypothetical protein
MAICKPKELFDVLLNPGAGWTTFHCFNDDAANRGAPRGPIAYFRIFWDEYEPEEGHLRYDLLDYLLERALKNGQQLNLGFKAMGWLETHHSWADECFPPTVKLPKPYRVPEWYCKLNPKGKWFEDPRAPAGANKLWEPDYADPLFLEKHGNLIRALGARYDGHPGLDRIDIGSIGAWGEWNCYGIPHPCWEARRILIDTYFDAFPTTPKTIVLGDKEALQYVLGRGGGWAAHCLGDMRDQLWYDQLPGLDGRYKFWNHMEDLYLQRICEVNGLRAWRRAPVMFETCWDLPHWYRMGWSPDYIFAFALAMHATSINLKSKPVPDEWWPAVDDCARKLGYRFVLREAEWPDRLRAGETAAATLRWENRGVAPCYHRHAVALRLKHERTGRTHIAQADTDVRCWYPGVHKHAVRIEAPPDFPVGPVRLQVALLSPHAGNPSIRLANAGRGRDGWYALGGLKVETRSRR